jgi:DNA-binding transcriptional LysR family regulator
MRPKNVAALTAFVQVAELQSFRAAASRLGVTPSALSQTMRQLEGQLGVRLLNRTTRSVSLTDAGIRLFDQLEPAFGQIDRAMEDLNRQRERPAGTLRIYATPGAAEIVVAPVWERFVSAYPEVQLELRVDTAPADIVAMGFDAVIGCQENLAKDMVAVRATGPLRIAVVAAPAYLARYGQPRTPEDLLSHRCIRYRFALDQPLSEWTFMRGGHIQRVPVGSHVILNSSELAVRAAIDGVGIAYAVGGQLQLFLDSGQLVRVLEEFSPSSEGFFVGYPSRRQISAALRAFLDIVRGAERSPGAELTNPFPQTPGRSAKGRSAT